MHPLGDNADFGEARFRQYPYQLQEIVTFGRIFRIGTRTSGTARATSSRREAMPGCFFS